MNKLDSNDITKQNRYHIGGVSFLNARPLLHGLETHHDIKITLDAPSLLGTKLDDGTFDCALVPSIDYQNSETDWVIAPTHCIGSDGPVLTVKILSKVPLDEITRIGCDLDSHTSIILSKILWQEQYGIALETVPLDSNIDQCEAILLIGDKVLKYSGRWAYECDLGQFWQKRTALPFVYAFWALPANKNADKLIDRLSISAQSGIAQLEDIAETFAHKHGFDKQLALEYFQHYLSFSLNNKAICGLKLFYKLAYKWQLIEYNRDVVIYQKCSEQKTESHSNKHKITTHLN
jgi:chorismate dehydratase